MDPLRPFANLIRSLWKAQAPPPTRAESTASLRPPTADDSPGTPAAEVAEGTLRSRIRTRLTQFGTADPQRTREIFVETVLAWELGEELPHDAGFVDVVRRVAEHIGAQPNLSVRLHTVLTELVDVNQPHRDAPDAP
jgi:hypothetical protein